MDFNLSIFRSHGCRYACSRKWLSCLHVWGRDQCWLTCLKLRSRASYLVAHVFFWSVASPVFFLRADISSFRLFNSTSRSFIPTKYERVNNETGDHYAPRLATNTTIQPAGQHAWLIEAGERANILPRERQRKNYIAHSAWVKVILVARRTAEARTIDRAREECEQFIVLPQGAIVIYLCDAFDGCQLAFKVSGHLPRFLSPSILQVEFCLFPVPGIQ